MTISFNMFPDEIGKITVRETLEYIRENVQIIKIPDKDLMKISLSELRIFVDREMKCTDGYVQKHNDGSYTIELIFKEIK